MGVDRERLAELLADLDWDLSQQGEAQDALSDLLAELQAAEHRAEQAEGMLRTLYEEAYHWASMVEQGYGGPTPDERPELRAASLFLASHTDEKAGK